jgi:hypothetical protein
MEEAFARAVEDGLKLTKRLVMPDGGPAPRPHAAMDRGDPLAPGERHPLLPTAPMAYAVVVDPGAVDSPDVPSYQPHVYGRLDSPALIPLQMREVDLRVDAAVVRAEVTLRARWWVHCVARSRACDCRLVVPMGHQVLPRPLPPTPISVSVRSQFIFLPHYSILACCFRCCIGFGHV